MKFRVDRDVLADAVAWAARSLPVRPSVPVLAGLLIEASHEGLVLSTFDYETSARATLHAEVADEGRALVSGRLLADICRSLPAKPVEMVTRRRPGLADLRLGAVQPADDAGRGLPDAARDAGRDRHRRRARRSPTRSAQAVTAAGRDDMLPVLTGVRIEIDGLDDLAAGHRPVPALPPRARAGTRARPTTPLAALVPAKVLGDTAKSLTAAARSPSRWPPRGTGEGIIGFEGAAAGGTRRTTTRLLDGEFPKVRSLFPSEHLTVAKVDKAAR